MQVNSSGLRSRLSPLPEAPLKVFGANVLPMELLVVGGALVMMRLPSFFVKTIFGGVVVSALRIQIR